MYKGLSGANAIPKVYAIVTCEGTPRHTDVASGASPTWRARPFRYVTHTLARVLVTLWQQQPGAAADEFLGQVVLSVLDEVKRQAGSGVGAAGAGSGQADRGRWHHLEKRSERSRVEGAVFLEVTFEPSPPVRNDWARWAMEIDGTVVKAKGPAPTSTAAAGWSGGGSLWDSRAADFGTVKVRTQTSAEANEAPRGPLEVHVGPGSEVAAAPPSPLGPPGEGIDGTGPIPRPAPLPAPAPWVPPSGAGALASSRAEADWPGDLGPSAGGGSLAQAAAQEGTLVDVGDEMEGMGDRELLAGLDMGTAPSLAPSGPSKGSRNPVGGPGGEDIVAALADDYDPWQVRALIVHTGESLVGRVDLSPPRSSADLSCASPCSSRDRRRTLATWTAPRCPHPPSLGPRPWRAPSSCPRRSSTCSATSRRQPPTGRRTWTSWARWTETRPCLAALARAWLQVGRWTCLGTSLSPGPRRIARRHRHTARHRPTSCRAQRPAWRGPMRLRAISSSSPSVSPPHWPLRGRPCRQALLAPSRGHRWSWTGAWRRWPRLGRRPGARCHQLRVPVRPRLRSGARPRLGQGRAHFGPSTRVERGTPQALCSRVHCPPPPPRPFQAGR